MRTEVGREERPREEGDPRSEGVALSPIPSPTPEHTCAATADLVCKSFLQTSSAITAQGSFFGFGGGSPDRLSFFADKGLTSAAVICIMEESRLPVTLETPSNEAHIALLRQTQGRKRLYPADSVGCRHCLPVAVASFRLRKTERKTLGRGIAGQIVFFADKGLTSAAVICIV